MVGSLFVLLGEGLGLDLRFKILFHLTLSSYAPLELESVFLLLLLQLALISDSQALVKEPLLLGPLLYCESGTLNL